MNTAPRSKEFYLKLRDAINNNPDFNMDVWIHGSLWLGNETDPCGTACCIAGAAAIIEGRVEPAKESPENFPPISFVPTGVEGSTQYHPYSTKEIDRWLAYCEEIFGPEHNKVTSADLWEKIPGFEWDDPDDHDNLDPSYGGRALTCYLKHHFNLDLDA